MTISTSLDTPAGSTAPVPVGAPAPPPPTGPAPVIYPGLRRLDRRRRTLAFTIRTFGLPYFEVLLTTERALFDSANAARRTPANFYASRQDGGLSPGAPQDSVFIVPTAALQRFANARPRASDIFYTVAAYASPESAPVLAAPPPILALTAPSVHLGADFDAQALAVVLAVPVEKLLPVGGEPPVRSRAERGADDEWAPTSASEGAAWSVEDDAPAETDDGIPAGTMSAWSTQEDEIDDDGIAVGESSSWSAESGDDEPPAEVAFDALDAFGDEVAPMGLEDIVDPTQRTNGHGPAPDLEDEPAAQAADDGEEGWAAEADESGTLAYDDGEARWAAEADESDTLAYDDGYDEALDYDGDYGDEREAAATLADDDGYEDGYDDDAVQAAESTFPPGASEPAALADVEEGLLDEELAGAVAYDELDTQWPSAAGTGDEEAGVYDALGNGAAPAPPIAAAPRALDIPGKIAIVTKLGRLLHSPDGFRAVGAGPAGGLRYGLVGFTQDRGDLGRPLTMMRERDAARFREVFGADSDELVRVTNQRVPRRPPGERSPRMASVGGHDLWTEPWLSRFRAAGEHPPFQAAQNELAVRRYLDPMLAVAGRVGMMTERSLALLTDLALAIGPRGAERWLARVLGAIAQPDAGRAIDALVAQAAAEGAPWRQRAETIRTSPEFADAPVTWTPPAASGRP